MATRPEPGDEQNAAFGQAAAGSVQDVSAGFDRATEERQDLEVSEGGHRRFPRTNHEDVPKAPLAERLRAPEGD
jgi:hypothetical protein